MTRFLELLSRIVYGVIALILLLLTVVLACDAVFQFFRQALIGGEVTEASLAGIGYVVVAIATFEIARYLTDEEVVRGHEIQLASEARRSLTRLVSTVAVAIFLEALVIVFHVGKENVPQLIYPTFLLIAAILIVVGLGFYQRLSASVEDRIEERDITASSDRPSPERSDR
ncbi:MAG: GNAT family acetyltransferase [Rhodoplanes sp.]